MPIMGSHNMVQGALLLLLASLWRIWPGTKEQLQSYLPFVSASQVCTASLNSYPLFPQPEGNNCGCGCQTSACCVEDILVLGPNPPSPSDESSSSSNSDTSIDSTASFNSTIPKAPFSNLMGKAYCRDRQQVRQNFANLCEKDMKTVLRETYYTNFCDSTKPPGGNGGPLRSIPIVSQYVDFISNKEQFSCDAFVRKRPCNTTFGMSVSSRLVCVGCTPIEPNGGSRDVSSAFPTDITVPPPSTEAATASSSSTDGSSEASDLYLKCRFVGECSYQKLYNVTAGQASIQWSQIVFYTRKDGNNTWKIITKPSGSGQFPPQEEDFRYFLNDVDVEKIVNSTSGRGNAQKDSRSLGLLSSSSSSSSSPSTVVSPAVDEDPFCAFFLPANFSGASAMPEKKSRDPNQSALFLKATISALSWPVVLTLSLSLVISLCSVFAAIIVHYRVQRHIAARAASNSSRGRRRYASTDSSVSTGGGTIGRGGRSGMNASSVSQVDIIDEITEIVTPEVNNMTTPVRRPVANAQQSIESEDEEKNDHV